MGHWTPSYRPAASSADVNSARLLSSRRVLLATSPRQSEEFLRADLDLTSFAASRSTRWPACPRSHAPSRDEFVHTIPRNAHLVPWPVPYYCYSRCGLLLLPYLYTPALGSLTTTPVCV